MISPKKASVFIAFLSFYLLTVTAYAVPPISDGDRYPLIAFDSHHNHYLLVFARVDAAVSDNYIIKGQFLDSSGNPKGDEFNIVDTQFTPVLPIAPFSLSFDSKNFRFLVTWADNRHSLTSGNDIYGQLINPDGTFYGDPIVISDNTAEQGYVGSAFDPVNQRFLVLWADGRDNSTTKTDIWGQILNADGSPYGNNFAISKGDDVQAYANVVNNPSQGNFLVVWSDYRSIADWDIYGRIVNSEGILNTGDEIIISNASESQIYPSATYNPIKDKFIVTWWDMRNDPPDEYDIYGQIVDSDGTLEGSNMVISKGEATQNLPIIAFSESSEDFLVMWSDTTNFATNSSDIQMQHMDSDFFLKDSAAPFKNSELYEGAQDIEHNSNCNNFMVSYLSYETDPEDYRGIIGDSCSAAPADFALLYPADGATAIPTSTLFKWNETTDPDGDDVNYALWYCEDPLFAGCSAYSPPETAKLDGKAGLLGLMIFLPALFLIPSKRKKLISIAVIAAFGIVSLSFIYACGSSANKNTQETVSGLKSNTKYYWKVIASDGLGGITHSETWSFTTK